MAHFLSSHYDHPLRFNSTAPLLSSSASQSNQVPYRLPLWTDEEEHSEVILSTRSLLGDGLQVYAVLGPPIKFAEALKHLLATNARFFSPVSGEELDFRPAGGPSMEPRRVGGEMAGVQGEEEAEAEVREKELSETGVKFITRQVGR